MDWNRIGLGIVVVVLGLTGYYGWPFVVAWWKKPRQAAVAAKPTADDAYKAVKTLVGYFESTGNTGGLENARNCGICLFNGEPPK